MPRDARTGAKYAAAGSGPGRHARHRALSSLASGLMAPGWAVGVFIAAWLVLFGLGCFWIRRKPLWVVAAAVHCGGNLAGRHECR